MTESVGQGDKHSLTQEILTNMDQLTGQNTALKGSYLSGVNTLVRRVETVRSDMQSQMIETLTADLEHFYRGAFSQMKDVSAAGSQGLLDSVMNTMKYISVGEAKGYSSTLLKKSLDSSQQMDQQMGRADQNFELRSSGTTNDSGQYTQTGTVKNLQRIALQHGMDQEDVGLAYRIGSRNYDHASEAVTFAEEVAKLHSVGNMDVEQTATGLEAVTSAWGSSGFDLSQVTDMMIRASTLLDVGIQDLMDMMRQTLPVAGNPDGTLAQEDTLANWISKAGLLVQSKGDFPQQGFASNRVRFDLLAEQLKATDANTSIHQRTGRRDNLQFRQREIEIALQIATHEAMQGLKEEFTELGDYLIAVMRLIGDRTDGIVDHMELLNRIMDEVGVQVAWDKFGEVMNEGNQKRYGATNADPGKVGNTGSDFPERLQVTDVQRAGVAQEMGRQQSRLQTLDHRRTEIQSRVTSKQDDVLQARTNRDHQHKMYNQAIQDGDTAASSIHAEKRDEAEKRVKTYSRELLLLREEMHSLDIQIAKTKRSLEFLGRELDDTSRAMMQLEHQARVLMMAMDDMDLDAVELRNKLYFLNAEFTYGSTDVQRYESEIQKLRKQSTLLNDVLSKLRTEVNELNASFRQGMIDATAYISKLKELEQVQLASMMSGPGGLLVVPGAGSSGSPVKDDKEDSANKPFLERHQDLINDAIKDMATSKIEEVMDFGSDKKKKDKPKRRGIKQRFEDMKEVGSKKAFFNGHAPIRDKDGKVLRGPDKPDGTPGDILTQRDITIERKKNGDIPGKWAKLGKLGKSILKPLKAVPYLGMAMTAVDVVSGLVDPLSNMGKSEAEKQSIRATNKEELAKDFKDMEQSSFVGKVWKGLNLGMDGIFKGGMSTLFGNNATNNKMGDYWAGFKAIWSEKGGDAVEKKLAKEYNYEQEKKEAQIQMDKESGKPPGDNTQQQPQIQYIPPQMQYIPAAGGIGAIANGYKPQPQSNGIDEMIAKINRQFNKSTSDNETNYQVTRSRLLISGVREDSGQMRALMEKYLQENIKFFDKAIASLQKTYNKMAEGKEKDELGLEINEKKQQKAQSELELNGVKNSQIDELRRKMNDQFELTELDYDKRMYDLLAANGGKEDAPEIIALNKSRASEMNSQISSIKQDWNNLLNSGLFKPGTDEYMQIFKQIQSLGVEQSKNLAEISKKMDKPISTFNIPAGLKVMDYFDYMTTNNTHKSVMVGSGDVTVHVNIDNMTGSTKDVERLTSTLDKTLRQNSPGIANRMASNVGARMGSNHIPR
ncbi:hypothetical protein QVE09_11370 [Paenibacillus sp. ClWae2A]|uniref:hypothetical protein n=1 Tax=Paenibacillus sp. ClWae2A TaxID=3057177 RepID=UPI0028F5BC80|nr:hypothetical protein [Paenibacillus sp. ClWae2A]MDT9719506.1 hypothetical protein [Paenibacillus sp. ClWae2A]